MNLNTIETKTAAIAIQHASEVYTDIIENKATSELDRMFYQGQRYMLRNLVEKMTNSLKGGV